MKKWITSIALSAIIFALLAAFENSALAWGGRGHHTICDAASFLVKEKGLSEYVTSRPQMMGHLCNVPDFFWKSLGPEVGKLGNPTHFIDIEITGLKIDEVPTDFKSIIAKYEGTENKFKEGKIFSIPTEFGSIWWRADQFVRRAIALGDTWKTATPPTNSKEEQDENLPYNKAAYEFAINIGVLGHYVGDAAQPFHGTADYDGYYSGHGGIHAYYEDGVVSAMPSNLQDLIVKEGRRLQKLSETKNKKEKAQVLFLTEPTTIDKMRALSIVSFKEIEMIYKLDPVLKKSELKKEKGMEIRTAAERPPAATAANKYEPLIVKEMGRAASLLAALWDEAYVKAGRPKLAAYKSYKYPFTPEFIPPDYFELPKSEAAKK